jgi:phosphoribosylanthranilate isomerase
LRGYKRHSKLENRNSLRNSTGPFTLAANFGFQFISFEFEMVTRVKICGITRREDAQLAVEFGASALGFNFYRPSPRYIHPAAARAIILTLPPLVTAVGIFADEPDEEKVAGIAKEARVTVVQLHGPKLPRLDGVLADVPKIRGVAVCEGFQPEMLRDLGGDTFLLDAYDAKLLGGTGKSFNWTLAREARRFGTIILAGGLTPENVGRAISEVQPFAVDVASGVESAPGVKDAGKLQAFFQEVGRADQGIDNGT